METAAHAPLLLGPMLIGTYLNTILYGVLAVQAFIYYRTYKRDRPWIRYLLLYLFVAETVNTVLNIEMMYEALVLRFGTTRALTRPPLMLSGNAIVTVMISTPEQLFVAWRIKVVSGSKIITAVISLCSLASLAGGVTVSTFVIRTADYGRFHEFAGAVLTWLIACAAADVIITTTLVLSLYRRKTGFGATDDAINRIIRLTVQTGMLTAMVAAAVVIMYLAAPVTTLMFIPDFALSKLYTNSLLSTLNARSGWRSLVADYQHNVLFDDSEERVGFSNTSKPNVPTVISGVYELNPQARDDRGPDHKRDARFGDGITVTVTKVVEQ